MSSLLKHQARCVNAPWQPRLASIDVCLAWHFSRIPNQALPRPPTGPPHLTVELFVFICLCLSATLCLSGLCPLRPSVRTSYFLKMIHWRAAVMASGSIKKKSIPRVPPEHCYSYTFNLVLNVQQASNIKDDKIGHFTEYWGDFFLLLEKLCDRRLSWTLKWSELQLEA